MPENPRPVVDSLSSGSHVRKLTVADAMILIVAVSLGAFGCRSDLALMTETGFGGFFKFDGWEMLIGPWLAALTAGLIVVNVLPPSPSRIDLFRRPGFAAVCVALALTGRRFLEMVIYSRLRTYDDWFLAMEWAPAMREASLGIFVVWSVLIAAGCSKPERGWLGRAAQVVAVLWAILGLVSSVLEVFEIVWIRNSLR